MINLLFDINVANNPKVRNNPSNIGEVGQNSMSFRQLNQSDRSALLLNLGYLFGVRVDDNNGPRISTFQVAKQSAKAQINIREMNDTLTEVLTTINERETNYIHQGWSTQATSTCAISPWALSRVASHNQLNRNKVSVTKRVMTQRVRVDVSLKDLIPSPEFEADIQAALDKLSIFDTYEALYEAFERWGDIIPLVFDLGTSLTITDSETNAEKYFSQSSYFGLGQLSTPGTARISTKGGDPKTFQRSVQEWLHEPVSVNQWSQVRIVRAVPTTALLSTELQSRLSELHQSLLSYCPETLDGATSGGHSFDDMPLALKTITSVTLCCDKYINSLSVAYLDGTCSAKHGGVKGACNVFTLAKGEYITELIVWSDKKGICALELITNTGRISPHYGGDGGTARILKSTGGFLAAFSGKVKSDIIHQIQGIWRHDTRYQGVTGERQCSPYYGGSGERPFTDWPLPKNSDSMHISSVKIRCGTYIDGIQFKYADQRGASTSESEGPYHGGDGGTEKTFSLKPGEHIVAVSGRQNKYIVQICFETNLGRKSDIFGGNSGTDFMCRAPQSNDGKAMRLHYACGKSGKWVNGLLFVWAPV